MLVSRSQFRQKSMKNRCWSWWLKRDRQNHGNVMIFPNDLRPLLGRISEKTAKKNEYGRFGTPWGCPWARKCRSGGGPKKCLHFCHEFDQMLAWFLIKMSCFCYVFVRVLKFTCKSAQVGRNKTVFQKRLHVRKPHDLPSRTRLRDKSPNRSVTQKNKDESHVFRMWFCCFFEALWLQFVHQFLIILFNRNGSQNGSKIDAKIVKRRPGASKGTTRTHWDCFVVVCERRKMRTRTLSKKREKERSRARRPQDVIYHPKNNII